MAVRMTESPTKSLYDTITPFGCVGEAMLKRSDVELRAVTVGT